MFFWWKRIGVFLFLIILIIFISSKISSPNPYSKKSTSNIENIDEKRKKMFGLDKIPEFQENPKLLDKWTKEMYSFSEINEWLKAGLKPNEYEFANWIVMVKSQKFPDFITQLNYQTPHWIKNNVNIEELRKEYLESKND